MSFLSEQHPHHNTTNHSLHPSNYRSSHQTVSNSTLLFVGAAHLPWTNKEVASKRRVVQVHATDAGTIAISCILWEPRKQYLFTSADFFKLVQFLFKLQLNDGEKKVYRRRLDRLHDYWTIRRTGENQALFHLIEAFSDPKPTHTRRSFKVFSWAHIDIAIENFLNRENLLKEPRLTLPEGISYTIRETHDILPAVSISANRLMEGSSRNDPCVSSSYSTNSFVPYHTSAERGLPIPFLTDSLITEIQYTALHEREQTIHPTSLGLQFRPMNFSSYTSWAHLQNIPRDSCPTSHPNQPSMPTMTALPSNLLQRLPNLSDDLGSLAPQVDHYSFLMGPLVPPSRFPFHSTSDYEAA